MPTFTRITKRDDPAEIAKVAARYEALLLEALAIAKRVAGARPQIVQDVLATGTVEGLAAALSSKAAAVNYRATKYKCTWHSLIPWENLEDATASEQAEGILDTVETNIRMTETDSWPKRPRAKPARRRRSRRK
jgi:hypothetical protein